MPRLFDATAKFETCDSDFPFPLAALAKGATVRVSKRVAREWLMHQQSVVHDGTIRHLLLQSMGIGIYQVTLRRRDGIGTRLFGYPV